MALTLYLRKGREVPIIRGHPWILSGAIARAEGASRVTEGVPQEDEADVLSNDGQFLGRATVHPPSQIRARVFSRSTGQTLDKEGVHQRIRQALLRRECWLKPTPESGFRMVYSESDDLPGLIVDRYGPVIVIQFLTAPWERRRDWVLDSLKALCNPDTIWDRSDVDVRRHEGLLPRKGLLWGRPLTKPVPFEEDGVRFLSDVEHGHKTGFYLDQRDSRRRVRDWAARLDRPRVLNVFSYTNSFGLAALSVGASEVVAIDSSQSVHDVAAAQLGLNPSCSASGVSYLTGDAFELLRKMRDAGESFDVIIVDPPRMAPSQKDLHRALRAYKDINLLACRLARPNGLLFTFSCSARVDRDLFGKVLEGAARDAERAPVVVESLNQSPDHPRRLGFAESEYLKGFVLAFGS